MGTPGLNVLELYKTIHDKKMKRHETFNHILKRIHRKIENAAKYEAFQLLYEVPVFIPGYPRYDIKQCLAYIMIALRKNGLHVTYEYPQSLLIRWDLASIRLPVEQQRQAESWNRMALSVSPQQVLEAQPLALPAPPSVPTDSFPSRAMAYPHTTATAPKSLFGQKPSEQRGEGSHALAMGSPFRADPIFQRTETRFKPDGKIILHIK